MADIELSLVDVIIIGLAIAILVHIILNRYGLATNSDGEGMIGLGNLFGSKPRLSKRSKPDSHNLNRSNGPLHQTKKNNLPYYHVTNKSIDNSSVDSTFDLDTLDSSNKLVLPDNYDGKLDLKSASMDMKGFLENNPFEELVDSKGISRELDQETVDLKRYIREYVLDGRDQCFCATDPSKSNFTRSEIDKYREQQIEFRDKTYQPSDTVNDAVDKMNCMTITGINAQNQTIADVYDSIVDTRDKTDKDISFFMDSPLPTQSCVSSPAFDLNAIPTGNYTESSNIGGQSFLRDNWMYTDENPNNGGIDCTNIKASDPMSESNLII